MTPDQLAGAIIQGILDGGEGFLEGTLAAALVLVWLIVLALHLARPYMLGTTGKFSLRLAADIWWVLYIGIRDLLLVVAFILSFMFLFPDVITNQSMSIGASLATACLFGALLVKLVADADADPRAFQLVSYLLAAGATLYIVPTLLGVQLSQVTLGDPWDGIAKSLVTANNPDVALPLMWFSLAAIGLMGAYAVYYNLRQPPQVSTPAEHISALAGQ